MLRTDVEATARRMAAISRVPYGIWQHNDTFRLVRIDKPDPPSNWELVSLIDPADVRHA